MKALIVSLLLLATTAFADSSIREYQGQVFSLENQAQCEQEFSRISNVINSIKGAMVIDGGCQMYGDRFVQINMKYEAPITTYIDRFRHQFKSSEVCEAQAALSSTIFSQSKNLFIASFCQGRTYRFDYIDNTYSVMRNLGLNAQFKTEAQCMGELKKIEKVVADYGMTTLISNCREFETIRRDGKYYRPEFFYLSVYSKKLNVIRGREVQNNCLSQRATIERDFADADIRLSHQFCSGYESVREYLVYLDESASVIPAIKEYQGTTYADAQTCEQKRADIVAVFAQTKKMTVYSYCEKRGETRHTPMVYYARK